MKRSSGVLLHPTSLPGKYGIGSFNRSAQNWIDFLAEAGQSVWQVLPLGPTSYGDSPYQSFSTFAGNPYLISLEELLSDGLLKESELREFPEGKVDYCQMYEWKLPLLRQVAQRIKPDRDFEAFCQSQPWLEDYALFIALKEEQGNRSWGEWPLPLRRRVPEALEEARQRHASGILGEKIIQWLFFRQWGRLRAYAQTRGIAIFGDIPIFVAMDSADTWCQPQLFQFDADLKPTSVAGVPPDYFAPTGQLWGNPLYDWKAHQAQSYQWWIERVRAAFGLYDLLRIDHFRGFAAYWQVPAQAKTAESGRWVQGPGAELFEALLQQVKQPIIAEDLGDITPDVIELRDRFRLPGMKILQFAFGSDAKNGFLPHNFESPNFVAYTGTHDNDTVRGWHEKATPQEKAYLDDYLGPSSEPVSQRLIRATLASTANLAVVPIQDWLDLAGEARMNFPGRSHDNWQWRLQPDQLTSTLAQRLSQWTQIYGRSFKR